MPMTRPALRPARRARLIASIAVTGAVAVFGPGAALAQQPQASETRPKTSEYARPGLYISVAGGGLIKTFKATGDPTADAGLDLLSQGAYIGGKIGSRHNRWIASETSVDYGVKSFGAKGTGSVDVNPLYLTGGIKLFATQGRVQPYIGGGIGGAWMFTKIKGAGGGLDGKFTTASFFARVGGGVDFHLNRHFAIGPEVWWNITTGDLENFRSLSLGGNLMFKF